MNFAKRAFLSVSKSIGKSILLILVLTVIGTMVLSGIAIQNSTNHEMNLAREKLGAEVTLSFDDIKAITGEISADTYYLKEEDVNKLINLPQVKNYNYITSGMVSPKDFDIVELFTEELDDKNMEVTIGGHVPDITLNGSIESNLLEEFTSEEKVLVGGRHLTNEDKGKNVALVSQLLMEKNNFEIGHNISIVDESDGNVTTLEIVGVYQVNQASDLFLSYSSLNPHNEIYIPYDIMPHIDRNIDAASEGFIEKAIYYLTSPTYVDEFLKDAKETDINFNHYKLNANDATYKRMTGPIENVNALTRLMVIFIAVAGVIILSLIIMLSLRDRKYEIGVLLSLGERRIKIISQLLLETVILALIAFSISIFLGNTVAVQVGDMLLEKELAIADEGANENITLGGLAIVYMDDIGTEPPIDKINVQITVEELQLFTLIGLVFVVLSTILPTIFVFRLNPRKILLTSA